MTGDATGAQDRPAPADAAQPPAWPSARGLVGRGLELAARTTDQLRPASLALGFQVLGLVGPLAILLIAVGTRLEPGVLVPLVDPSLPAAPEDEALASIVATLMLIAAVGLAAILLEGRLIATALLGGRLVGRPLALSEALRRSRQSFWRVVRATLLVQVPLVIVGSWAGDSLEAALGLGAAFAGLGSALVTTVLGAPFAYVTTSVVLGDVAAVEAVRRSLTLARARWRLALVVGLFAAFAQVVLVFGLTAGLDVLSRVSSALGLGLDQGSATTFVTLVVVLFAVIAVGTLLFTVAAIVAAPEVVAFVGLTGFSAGLDRARDSAMTDPATGAATGAVSAPPAAPRRVRWLTVPMAVGIGLAILLSISGLTNVLAR